MSLPGTARVIWNLVACLATALLARAEPAIIDEFDADDGWTLPIYQYGIAETGDAEIVGGTLRVTHRPVGRYHMVSAQKTYSADARQSVWLHFRFRELEPLLGANMYTHVWLGPQLIAEFGMNGEQHWRMFSRCERKEWDDELFFGSPIIMGEEGGKNTDMRVALPEPLLGEVRYTDYHVFSVKLELAGDDRRLRLFVDGFEPLYRDIDAEAPRGAIDNRIVADFQALEGPAAVRVGLGIMTDGDLYADTSANGGEGIRWLHAFADMTPALPHPEIPSSAVKRDSVMLWDWVMIVPDARARELSSTIHGMVARGDMAPGVARRLDMLSGG